MRIGKLKHLGSIEKYVNTPDAMGGIAKQWELMTEAYCSLKPLNGNEKYVSQEKHATATHQVLMRYVGGLDTKMRLLVRGRIFEIKAILNINEEDKMLQLIVEEDADVG